MSNPYYMHEFLPNRKGICIFCHDSKEANPHVRWQQHREGNPTWWIPPSLPPPHVRVPPRFSKLTTTRSERLQREREYLERLDSSVQGEELRESLVRIIEILEAE